MWNELKSEFMIGFNQGWTAFSGFWSAISNTWHIHIDPIQSNQNNVLNKQVD